MAFLYFCLTWLTLGCSDDKLYVFDHPGYAIGTVVFYSGGHSHFPGINFLFSVKGTEYRVHYSGGHNGWHVPDAAHIDNNDLFMVQYDSLSPGTARLLFDYPFTRG
jgi:hypothetical protein